MARIPHVGDAVSAGPAVHDSRFPVIMRPLVAGEMREVRTADIIGARLYEFLSTMGYVIDYTHTDGAVTLWNPEGYEGGPFDDVMSQESLGNRWRNMEDPMPKGTHAENWARVWPLAVALHDGAYVATINLEQHYHFISAPKAERPTIFRVYAGHPFDGADLVATWSIPSDAQTQDEYHAMSHAYLIGAPTYVQTRDRLYYDERAPYIVACLIAAQLTDFFRTRPISAAQMRANARRSLRVSDPDDIPTDDDLDIF